MSYQAKQDPVLASQLKVQTLILPFKITADATPADKVITRDDPAVLFLAVEGIDQITSALSADDTVPTLATETDATGIFSVLVKIGEPLAKVVGAKLIRRNGQEVISLTLPAAPDTGIVAGGALDKIVLNADSGVNLSSADFDGCLEVHYVVTE